MSNLIHYYIFNTFVAVIDKTNNNTYINMRNNVTDNICNRERNDISTYCIVQTVYRYG